MISSFFIDRPVLANVLAIVFVLLGAVALFDLPVAQYPNVVPPTVQVTTRYPGASAETVMNTVALPIEQQVNGVQHMLYMQSTSANDGTYTLTVTFDIGTDLNFAQVLVQNRVASATASLPQSVQAQGVVVQQKSTAILQIVTLTAPDGRFDSLYLSNYATINLVNELSRLPGVGNVNVFGVGQYSMRVWLDPEKLQARGLGRRGCHSGYQAAEPAGNRGPGGRSAGPGRAGVPVYRECRGTACRRDRFRQHHSQGPERHQRGHREHYPGERRRQGGTRCPNLFAIVPPEWPTAAGMAIFQFPDANALAVATSVRAKMAELAKAFPQGLVWGIPFDTTGFVNASIHEVYKTLIEAGILVLVVILVFLQDWRATLVPATTVPVTIIGAFAAMAALGFTINLSTLFAVILAIGIVVDDAIVVVEGAAHHMERGLSAHDGTIQAMKELFGPIIGITLVLMSVFVPAAFLPGLTGQMYAQFAMVIAATALISAINAATLKPTQCALWLRPPVPPEQRNILSRAFNRAYAPLQHGYAALIGHMVRHSILMALLALCVAAVAIWGVARLPTAFIPIEDQGYVIIGVQLPDGASLERTQRALDGAAQIARATPGVDQVIEISGISVLDNSASLASSGAVYVILKDWGVRGKAKGEDLRSIYGHLQGALDEMAEASAFVVIPPPIQGIGNASGFNMMIELRDGSVDFSKLETITRAVVADGASQSGLQHLINTFRVRCAATRGPGGSRQGGKPACAGRRCVRHAVLLCRIELCQPVQQIRPNVSGLRPGGRKISPASGRHSQPQGP